MRQLYAFPLRVYLFMGILALIGIFAGLRLPISLFPNSAQPIVWVNAGYGPMSADEYRDNYGEQLESSLRAIQTNDVSALEVDATYYDTSASLRVTFRWGDNTEVALREVNSVLAKMQSQIGNYREYYLSADVRNENSGFLALSFYSKERSPSQIFDIIDPILSPKLKQIKEAQNPSIWNPQAQEIHIQIKTEALTGLRLSASTVEADIRKGFETRQGGKIIASGKTLHILAPKVVTSIEDLGALAISTPSKRLVPLRDIATITVGPSQNSTNIFKTSGASSVVLFSTPKPGGNVKAMAEGIIALVNDNMRLIPSDIQFKLLVDPSEFIRASITNVAHEVLIGSILAVIVLLIFIGSPKNVATAAIEIPISLVLAFILMRVWGMNINLISLGGLALSAGMNVDASVVVMENIFRHFETRQGKLSYQEKLETVLKAVAEVRGPVIASTISSLVVFLPLAFTSNLSYAILGDLAKAVVFSHGFSAIVALILVPTVRLHIMRSELEITHPKSPIEKQLGWIENRYIAALSRYISSFKAKTVTWIAIPVTLGLMFYLILPRLPKEIVGKPDTDWIFMSIQTDGNTKTRQMEMIIDEVERKVTQKIGNDLSYTFLQVWHPNGGALMLRLKDKSEINRLVKTIDENFKNTATLKIWSGPWNPSELPLPNLPQLKLAISGSNPENRAEAALEISNLLESRQVFSRIRSNPDATQDNMLQITPNSDQLKLMSSAGADISFDDILQQIRVHSSGRYLGSFPFDREKMAVTLGIFGNPPGSVEEISAYSVPFAGKIIPFRALADIKEVKQPPVIRRINNREINYIEGTMSDSSKSETRARQEQASSLINSWMNEYKSRHPNPADIPTIEFEDGEFEITEAIDQLSIAIMWSIVLIFLTMVIQFGSFIEPLIILAAIPLGIIGVLLSLFVFRSSLSLNSALGVILLNGISVANSIILVDFTKKLVDSGEEPLAAALAAAKARLRPILITSLTTVLGMLPIACGFGEGGKVLQPLGIAVAGGLWVSMLLTLFVVPALHVTYLNLKKQ